MNIVMKILVLFFLQYPILCIEDAVYFNNTDLNLKCLEKVESSFLELYKANDTVKISQTRKMKSSTLIFITVKRFGYEILIVSKRRNNSEKMNFQYKNGVELSLENYVENISMKLKEIYREKIKEVYFMIEETTLLSFINSSNIKKTILSVREQFLKNLEGDVIVEYFPEDLRCGLLLSEKGEEVERDIYYCDCIKINSDRCLTFLRSDFFNRIEKEIEEVITIYEDDAIYQLSETYHSLFKGTGNDLQNIYMLYTLSKFRIFEDDKVKDEILLEHSESLVFLLRFLLKKKNSEESIKKILDTTSKEDKKKISKAFKTFGSKNRQLLRNFYIRSNMKIHKNVHFVNIIYESLIKIDNEYPSVLIHDLKLIRQILCVLSNNIDDLARIVFSEDIHTHDEFAISITNYRYTLMNAAKIYWNNWAKEFLFYLCSNSSKKCYTKAFKALKEACKKKIKSNNSGYVVPYYAYSRLKTHFKNELKAN
ncbi:hypothetical protein NGRA_0393 [Nosema granulosis]|uniref:Uncharacterized protein n=1 Tax=Nosema granulosis TaxID=83296 RepID=A0A9P6H0Z6_9MICR|nr:hypothetical protein NGRA_0393 [Nosema granulosis]